MKNWWKVICTPSSLKRKCNSSTLCTMIRRLRSDRNTESWFSVFLCFVCKSKVMTVVFNSWHPCSNIYCYICWVDPHMHLYMVLSPSDDLARLSYTLPFPRPSWIYLVAQGAFLQHLPDLCVLQILFPLHCTKVAVLRHNLRFCVLWAYFPNPHDCPRFRYWSTHWHPHHLSLSPPPHYKPIVLFHLSALFLGPVSDGAHVLHFLGSLLQSTTYSASLFQTSVIINVECPTFRFLRRAYHQGIYPTFLRAHIACMPIIFHALLPALLTCTGRTLVWSAQQFCSLGIIGLVVGHN